MTGTYTILIWINPQNVFYDRETYTPSSDLDQQGSVGVFDTKLISASNESIVSTATLSGVMLQDDGNQGIMCRYNETQTVTLSLSGKLEHPLLSADDQFTFSHFDMLRFPQCSS